MLKVIPVRLGVCALFAISLGGCGASLPSLSTGTLMGGQAAAPTTTNDPISRAIQVGSTSARAVKCGYNFDPQKLKYQFIAAESAANPADAPKLTQIYDTAYNGVSKAVATQDASYCSEAKTRKIKDALTRHLAGDYTPAAPEPVQDDGGLFGSLSSSSSSSEGIKQSWPTDNR